MEVSNSIEIIPLELTDTNVFSIASSSRKEEDYTFNTLSLNLYIPPPNIVRSLLSPTSSIAKIQATVRALGIKKYKLLFIRYKIQTAINQIIAIPVDMVGSFQYICKDGTLVTIAGKPMISLLLLLKTVNLTNIERINIIKHYLGRFLHDITHHDIAVISIPPRVEIEKSQIHQAFMSFEDTEFETLLDESGNVLSLQVFLLVNGTTLVFQ